MFDCRYSVLCLGKACKEVDLLGQELLRSSNFVSIFFMIFCPELVLESGYGAGLMWGSDV